MSMFDSKTARLLSALWVCDLELCEDGAGENDMSTLRPLRVPAPPGALPALGQAHSQARPGVLGRGGEVVFVNCGWTHGWSPAAGPGRRAPWG